MATGRTAPSSSVVLSRVKLFSNINNNNNNNNNNKTSIVKTNVKTGTITKTNNSKPTNNTTTNTSTAATTNKQKSAPVPTQHDNTDPSLLKRRVQLKTGTDYHQLYEVKEFIGSGRFGEVNRLLEKATRKMFAGKTIAVHYEEERKAVVNEIEIMKRLRHVHLLQLYDAFEYKGEMTLVLELVTGGELFERVIDASFDLTEDKCVKFMHEICQGVEFIHTQKVIHLDLKPENILCLTKTGFKIKIIDFGLARFYSPTEEVRLMMGTAEFISPEVIAYDALTPAADMWAVGVIAYVLLSGLSPFMGDTDMETMANVAKVKYTFNYPEFKEISQDAKDWITKLFVKNPKQRMTAKDSLYHNWLRNSESAARQGNVSKQRLRHFVYRRKWQKAVNAIIALLRMGVSLHHNYR